MHIVVLGAGLVGSAIVKDLAAEPSFQVTAVDRDQDALDRLSAAAPVTGVCADLGQPGCIASLVAGCDLVVSAVPGWMGFETLRQVIEAGKNVVDISFFAQDAFLLDELARARGVTAVVDCGVAPGLCNVIAGYIQTQLQSIERYTCYVGGLPQVRRWPYEYRAVFSPSDVIEEYTRPARLVEYGRQVTRPALSGLERRDFEGVGTLEAFYTDGLRSLLRTLDAPFMEEKTLRYPGHAELMCVLRAGGFFSDRPLDVDGCRVTPLAVTSRLLFEQWRLEPGEADLTVLQVILSGQRDGKGRTYTYDLLDRYDPQSGVTSMARTTGYTCALVARLVANRLFDQKGICPPEFVGRTPGCYEALLEGYAARRISLQVSVAGHE